MFSASHSPASSTPPRLPTLYFKMDAAAPLNNHNCMLKRCNLSLFVTGTAVSKPKTSVSKLELFWS